MSGRLSETVVQQDRHVHSSDEPEQLRGRERPHTSVGSTPLYRLEEEMATGSGKCVCNIHGGSIYFPTWQSV